MIPGHICLTCLQTRDPASTMTVVSPLPIARLNFPPYVALVLNPNYILVAGGGGSSRTGVANRMDVYEVNRVTGQAIRVSSFDTGTTALMNGTVFDFEDETFVAAGGIGGVCQVFRMQVSTDNDVMPNGNHNSGSPLPEANGHMYLRRRNSSSPGSEAVSNARAPAVSPTSDNDETISLNYNVQPVQSFKCDFNPNQNGKDDESFLKVLKFCPQSEVLVTGGSDGHVRVWKLRTATAVRDIPAHSDEIVDLDIDLLGKCLATISRDGRSSVWSLANGEKVSDLEYVIPVAKNAMQPIKYKFKGCRFLTAPEAPQVLFTTLVPATWSKKPEPCYLCRWSPRQWRIERRVIAGTDPFTHMSIR